MIQNTSAARSSFAQISKVINPLTSAFKTPAGRIGLPLVLLHVLLAAFGSFLAPYSPTDFSDATYVKPFTSAVDGAIPHILGTDQFGRDVFSRLLSGARSIILISGIGSILGVALGTAIGMTSGYLGGKADEIIMRIADGLMSFPSLLLALLVLSVSDSLVWLDGISSTFATRKESILVIGTMAIVHAPRVARVLRSATLTIKTQEYVDSARLRGESAYYIIFKEILPNALPVLAVEGSVRFSYAILLASSLGFLGLGVEPPSPDWGAMISDSRSILTRAPWVPLAPAAAVASLVVGVNLLTEGIRDAQKLPTELPE
ncbi:MAG TPA: ABC transporter permease [Dehalococcoidia bacterium]|nr:ABC transporter permease [Dehalococcoidia bacterium]